MQFRVTKRLDDIYIRTMSTKTDVENVLREKTLKVVHRRTFTHNL